MKKLNNEKIDRAANELRELLPPAPPSIVPPEVPTVGNRKVTENSNMLDKDLIGISRDHSRTHTIQKLTNKSNESHKIKTVKWKDEICETEKQVIESSQI